MKPMAGMQKSNSFSTLRKDEAAFYLSELAKGVLRDRVTVPVNGCASSTVIFDAMRLEMKVHEREERWSVEIRLSWSKPMADRTAGHRNQNPRGETERDKIPVICRVE
jgi:hypothetical protein